MKSPIALALIAGSVAAVVSAQSASSSFPRGNSMQNWQNPGLKKVLAKCGNPPQPFSIPGAGGAANANAAPPDPVLPATSAIPGVLAAGQSWKVVWSWEGNNVDGPIAGENGTVLFANNDASNIMQLDPSTGLARIVYRDTNTGGAISRSKNGALFVAERGLGSAIEQLEPQRKMLANSFHGEPLDCVGGVVNDLMADARGGVYFSVTGEVEKEVQAYELLEADYPHDYLHTNVDFAYAGMGQLDKALAEAQESVRLIPNSEGYANVAGLYLALNRWEDAKATISKAFELKLDGGALRAASYELAFLLGDVATMEREVTWAAGKPGDEDYLLSAQSDTEAYYGRMARAREFSRRAVDSAVSADSKESAASWRVNAALREAELGNAALARQGVAEALALSSGRDVTVGAALTLARTGEASRAKALAEELGKTYPTNTLLKAYWLSTINAAIEISKSNSSQAIVDLEAAGPYEQGSAEALISNLYPAYVRGQAYLSAHNGAAAASEFQKLLDHRGIVNNFVTGSLAHLQIGRAYAMAGDTTKAKVAYQDFFTLWKEADPDIPILKQAKAEYAKLQ